MKNISSCPKTCRGEDRNSGIAQKCKFFIWRPPLSFWQSDCPWYTHPSHATILLIRFLHEIYFFLWSSVVLWAEVGLLSVQLHWVGSASWMSSSFFLWQRFWDWVNMVQSMQFHTQSQNVEKYWYRFDILTKNKKCYELDPVGSTVLYEMMKLCTGSVKDTMRR